MCASFSLVPYQDPLREAFERLNRAWIERYFTVEPADAAVFADPRAVILSRGGEIFFALRDGEPVGTCTALPLGGGDWELAKLAVDEAHRGQGIARALCVRVIDHCRDGGARRVLIETNRKLGPALQLYRKLGFVEYTPTVPAPFERANAFFELPL